MRRGNPTGDGLRSIVRGHGGNNRCGRITVIVRGDTVESLIKHGTQLAGLRDGQIWGVVVIVENQITVICGARPGVGWAIGDVDRTVRWKREGNERKVVAIDAGGDFEAIDIGRHGVGDKNGPSSIGETLHQRGEVAVAPRKPTGLAEAIRIEMVLIRANAIRWGLWRSELVITERKVGRRGVRG